MSTMDRLEQEQAFHDRQARSRAATFEAFPERLRFDDSTYIEHENWIGPAFAMLGEVRGLSVLDFGCGHGMAAVVLARRGARVTAFDLSFGYVEEACCRAQANGVDVSFVKADGERLPFANATFDRIWGNAVLHHLDLALASREIARVLRPGGIAVFCEPCGENPVLNWARRRLPYSNKEHTPDEQPLRFAKLKVVRRVFPRLEIRGFQLLAMARRFAGGPRFEAGLDWCDQMLLTRVPGLQRFCRYVVLVLRK